MHSGDTKTTNLMDFKEDKKYHQCHSYFIRNSIIVCVNKVTIDDYDFFGLAEKS